MKRMTRPALSVTLFLVLAAWSGGGCAAVVRPGADVADLADPVPVFVADYGVHSSVFLPAGDGRFVEYAFGDWNYAANNHTWPNDAVGALVVSFQSALGRRFYDYRLDTAAPDLPAGHPKLKLDRIYCERAAVREVVADLDARYRAAVDAGHVPRRNPENGIEFVKDAEHYSLANNCNHLTARSLRKLGCDVRGVVVSANFRVADAPPAARKPAPVPGWETASVE